jgi:hypothetical protein
MDADLASRLLGAIAADNLVIFCGAGLSMAPPSSIPSARQLAMNCFPKYGLSIGADALPPETREDLEAQCRFAWSRGELQKLFLDRLVDWRPFIRNPNKGHKTVADLLAVRALRSAATTNFDFLVELAAQDLGEPIFRSALDGVEAATVRPHQTYLKIHGCAVREPNNTLWCKEQITPGSPLQNRIESSKAWLKANLIAKDLVLVGFWSDWDYLINILEECINGLEPRLVVVVDPQSAPLLESKAPRLWAWANDRRYQFHHAQESGADFLDELRRRFSIQFLERMIHNAKDAYRAVAGKAYVRPRTFDLTLSADELYALRRDVEGLPSSQIARQKNPTPQMRQIGCIHMRLVEAGATFEGARFVLNSRRIRVLQGAGDVLSLIKNQFEEEETPLGADVIICVGARDDGDAPSSIVRGSSSASIIKPVVKCVWMTDDKAVDKLGL